MHFTKMQGAGNDYVVVEANGKKHNWSELVKVVCDRHYGVGCDSLLVLLPSDRAQFRMRVFDTDGSEAESCGNGIRCLAKYVFEKGMVADGVRQVQIETQAGVRRLKVTRKDGKVVGIQANMGEPRFAAEEIPVVLNGATGKIPTKPVIIYPAVVENTPLPLKLVSMGNPHAIYFSDKPVSEFPMSKLGPKVEWLPIFPNRVNFSVARVIDRHTIEARVWERGVGETLACGTGSCAITAAAQRLGYVGDKVDIKLGGGTLHVEWQGNDGVLLSGPAEIVFEGEWPDKE